MSYTAISDETAQNYIDILSSDTEFSKLSSAGMLQYISFGQHECSKISKENNLDWYRVTQNMCTVVTPVVDITDGDQILVGANGYISSIDLSTYDIDDILGIQIGTTTTGTVITNSSSFDILAGFVNDTLCPDTAYCWNVGTLNVFCKTSVYPYTGTTLVSFWYYRYAINITATTSKVDIPSEMQQIAMLLILKKNIS